MTEGKAGRVGGGGTAPRVSIARLPATGRELFGREAEIAWLDACWRDGVHVASVVAWGGVGKSALVKRWLARKLDEDWDGAERVYAWSFYAQGTGAVSSSDEFIADALKEFGETAPPQESPWDKGARLARLVRSQRTLLVLDGIEPLQWGPGVQQGKLKDPALEALITGLAANNNGLCLITSRFVVADIEALEGRRIRTKRLSHLSPEAGAELLKDRGVTGTVEELRAASVEYDGHGLALTLLGSYLGDVAEGDIRRRKEIGPLEADERKGGNARRVMAAYEPELGKPEVSILRMIGLFDRPADEEELKALRAAPEFPGLTDALVGIGARDWNKAIAKLRRAGLLSIEQDKRIDAHPLVREHFGEQLKREQPEAWREGHRRLYEYLKGKAKKLPETMEEMAPLYAAVVHGCLAGKNQEALDEVYCARINRGHEGFNVHKLGAFGSEVAVLSAFFDPPWERLAPGLSEPYQAFVLNEAGFALRALGRLPEAAELLRLSLEHRIAQENWKNAAISASNFSELLQTLGALREALTRARESVEHADRSGDAAQRRGKRTTLAAAQHAVGLRAEAAAQFEEAERMQKAWQPAYPLLYSLPGFRYCDLLLEQGRDADVRERAAQTLREGEATDSLLDVALEHLSLGCAHRLGAQYGTGGDLVQASSHLQQAVEGLRRAGFQEMLPLGLLARAALHTDTGNYPAAHHDLEEALSLANRCGFRLHEADAHLGYARLALAEHKPASASEHLAKARAIVEKTGYHRRDAELAQLDEEIGRGEMDRKGARDARGEGARSGEGLSSELAPDVAAFTSSGSGNMPLTEPVTPRIIMPNIPAFRQPVLDAYRNKKLAVLFGSGLSMANDVTGGFPRWNDLPDRLLDQVTALGIWNQGRIDAKRASFHSGHLPLEEMLVELDTVAGALRTARKYQAALNAIFRPANARPGDVHRALVALDVGVLATTNYDQLLEHAEGPPTRSAYTWKDSDKALSDIEEHRKVLFKIHGSAENESTIVMTRREYDVAAADASYQRIMSHLWQNHTFLIVGYGINDPLDLDLVFGLNAKAFGAASRTHYALMHKSVSATDRDRWQRDMNIQTMTYDDYGDLPAILRALAANPRNPP